jgi:hypothetical protein
MQWYFLLAYGSLLVLTCFTLHFAKEKPYAGRTGAEVSGRVLCCAVLCCAVLCCAVLCCAVLCCAVLCCAVLCCAAMIVR